MITTVAGTGEPGYGNGRIRAVAPDGTIRTLVPDFGPGSDLVVAARGGVYVTQPESRRIRRVDAATGAVTTVTGG